MGRFDETGRGDPVPRPASAAELEPDPNARVTPVTGSVSPERLETPPITGSFDEVSARDVEEQKKDDDPENETRRIRASQDLPPGAPPRDVRIGLTLAGRYRIEKLIGKGGMGRVYLATQLPLGRSVAIKILSPEFQKKDPQFVRRFFLEAATASRLNHPNTITVYDYGESEQGELFIAMEFLKGRPLSRVLTADGAFASERMLHVAVQIVRALREAHAKGIIHRDLKPGNIMLLDEGDDADFAKVLDFGLVKTFAPPGAEKLLLQEPDGEVGELTRAGMFLGSPKYMSPEQIQGKDLDPRTDIYSLGVIMYQMLVGRVPFRGASSVEIIYKHVNEPVPAVHQLNPEADCPPELEAVIKRTLAKDRQERYASMGDLLTALKDVRRAVLGSASGGTPLDLLSQYPIRDTGMLSAELPTGLPRASSIPPMSQPPREAAFQDALGPEESAELSGRLRRRGFSRPEPSSVRLLPWAGLMLLLGVLGGGAYVLSSSGRSEPEPAPIAAEQPRANEALPALVPAPPAEPQPPAKLETTIRFQSQPPGAQVSEAGRVLGTTPFEEKGLREAGSAVKRTFVFKREGYDDERVQALVDSDSMQISTSLRPHLEDLPEPDLVSPAKKKERERRPSGRRTVPVAPEYKENPY